MKAQSLGWCEIIYGVSTGSDESFVAEDGKAWKDGRKGVVLEFPVLQCMGWSLMKEWLEVWYVGSILRGVLDSCYSTLGISVDCSTLEMELSPSRVSSSKG